MWDENINKRGVDQGDQVLFFSIISLNNLIKMKDFLKKIIFL